MAVMTKDKDGFGCGCGAAKSCAITASRHHVTTKERRNAVAFPHRSATA